MAMILVAVLCVSSNSALAASVSGEQYTAGGTGGQTLITATLSCYANYNTTVDACVLNVKAASLNTIPMSYTNLKSTSKSGTTVVTSASGYMSSAVNSKTWTIATGNAGTVQSSEVEMVTASSTVYGGAVIMTLLWKNRKVYQNYITTAVTDAYYGL